MTKLMKQMSVLSTGKNNSSVRVTIPEFIKEYWELKPTDKLDFIITIENNEFKVELKKVEK